VKEPLHNATSTPRTNRCAIPHRPTHPTVLSPQHGVSHSATTRRSARALGVDDGRVISDPLRRTRAALELARLRVAQPRAREWRGLLRRPTGGIINKVVQWRGQPPFPQSQNATHAGESSASA
jgi:hypothetical protein